MTPQFVSEHVVLEVTPSHAVVHGSYVIASDGPCGILYPFLEAPPESVWMQVAGSEGAWVVPQEDGAHIRLPFTHADRCTLQVTYAQPLPAHHAAYLLRTAQLWERPLERAEIEVVFPEALGSPTFSYPFERVDGRWRFTAENWAPNRDLVVEW